LIGGSDSIPTFHFGSGFAVGASHGSLALMKSWSFRPAGLCLTMALFSGCKDDVVSSQPVEKSGVIELEESPPSVTGSDPVWSEIDDPAADGWESEVFSERASDQLKKLGELFFEEGSPASLLAADFVCDELIPGHQNPTYRDGLIEVERLPKTAGNASLEGSLAIVRDELSGDSESRRSKFKIVRVDRAGGLTRSEQIFLISYRTVSGTVEIQSRWAVDWVTEGKDLKIAAIRVSDFERTTTAAPGPLFSDVTSSVLGTNDCYQSQLSFGLNHWLERMPVRAMLDRFGTPGLAVGDVNGDGRDDLYLCQEPGLPNRLFIQKEDGSAEEVAKDWGVDWIDGARSALLLDLDNDGDQDLVVAIYGAIVVARNEAGGGFEVAGAFSTSGSTASLASADYDGDGLLDLYVCAYVQSDDGSALGASGERFVYHDANNGAPNSLFRNTGDLGFTEVTKAVGLDQNNQRWSFSASWEDFDNDGDQDLYVANDYGRNNLYRNEGGSFDDIAATTGVEDSASGMSASWGDFDQDGNIDLYVSNMFSAAGNRVVTQKKFREGGDENLRGRFLRFARGNTLFRNLGDGRFSDTSEAAGVTLGRWAWGSNFVDFNNDSWPDLMVANGYLSSDEDSGDL
jgi:hypothetical protein